MPWSWTAGLQTHLMRRIHALLLLEAPDRPAFRSVSQALATSISMEILAADLMRPGAQPLVNAHIFGPILGR